MADEHITEQEGIEIPCSCAGPMTAAFGVTLLFAGIVTTWSVALIGLVFALAGAVHWWREVLPDPREYAPLIDLHPDPVTPRHGQVARIMKHPTHRARVPLEIHPYSAGVVGGIVGGVAMAIVATIGGLVSSDSLWLPVNVLAGTVLPSIGDMTLAQLSAFHGSGLAVGIGIHAIMSVFIGMVYGVMMPLFPRWPLLWAAVVIPAIWCGLTWASISVVNPSLATNIDWLWFIGGQLAFGLTCGWWILRTEKISTMQNWSYLERIGMDSPGVPDMHTKDRT